MCVVVNNSYNTMRLPEPQWATAVVGPWAVHRASGGEPPELQCVTAAAVGPGAVRRARAEPCGGRGREDKLGWRHMKVLDKAPMLKRTRQRPNRLDKH